METLCFSLEELKEDFPWKPEFDEAKTILHRNNVSLESIKPHLKAELALYVDWMWKPRK